MSAAPTASSGPARDVEILARTLWGEAASRPVRAIEAVAALIVNRVRAANRTDGPQHWGQDVAAACRAPFQFPCWNPNHPRHRVMLEAPAGDGALAICRRIAARAVSGVLQDPTGGATHCHAADILPGWAVRELPCAEIGGLVFYCLTR